MGEKPGAASADPAAPPATPEASAPPEVNPPGAGVRSLMRGSPPAPAPVTSPPPFQVCKPRPSCVPRWYLFGADLLLVALALLVMYKSPTPLNWGEKIFGIAAVILGAGLALIALCVKEPKGPKE